MNYELKKRGFSLTEVMMASAILAIGLIMIAGTFPVGIFLTAATVEQTLAPIATDEAFAKIRLYRIDPALISTVDDPNLPWDRCVDFNSVSTLRHTLGGVDPNEYMYPSVNPPDPNRVYRWSALCRRADANGVLVQVTVLISRKAGKSLQYPDGSGNPVFNWPTPLTINVNNFSGNTLIIDAGEQNFVNAGSVIVANKTGNIYRVREYTEEMKPGTSSPSGNMLAVLDKDWTDGKDPNTAWVVPPAVRKKTLPTDPTVTIGRSPCIGVYQRIIKF